MLLRRPFLSLVLLLLCACQAAPAPEAREEPPGPPIAYPPEAKRRLLAIADREWREFGAPEIDYTGWIAIPIRRGLAESDLGVFPNVLAYWNAVRDRWAHYVRDQKERYQSGDAGVWRDEAWSAAFVSYVMRTAGIDRDDFPWSAAHRHYVDALIERHRAYGAAAAFQVYDVADYAPRPGDLICADRSRPLSDRITTVAERAAEAGRPRGMHCDIVVAVEPGRAAAIGGNVGDAVARSWFPTDGRGRLLRRIPPEDPSERTFFAVIRTNMADPAPVAVFPAGPAGRTRG